MKRKILIMSFIIATIIICTIFVVNTNSKIADLESKIGDFNYGAIKISNRNLENLNSLLDKELTSENYESMLLLLQQSEEWLNVGFLQMSTNDSISNNITLNNLNPKTTAEYFDSVKDIIEASVRELGAISKVTANDSNEINAAKEKIKSNILQYKNMTEIIEKAANEFETNEERNLELYDIFNTNKTPKIISDLQVIYREVLF